MASKKEEKAAFERLKKEFPDNDVSLTSFYCLWREDQTYYATINEMGSSAGTSTQSPDEAVDLMIMIAKEAMSNGL